MGGPGPCYYARRDAILGPPMSDHPATTVKVVSIEPLAGTQVRIMMEMIADVHRLAEVGSELLRASVDKMKREQGL